MRGRKRIVVLVAGWSEECRQDLIHACQSLPRVQPCRELRPALSAQGFKVAFNEPFWARRSILKIISISRSSRTTLCSSAIGTEMLVHRTSRLAGYRLPQNLGAAGIACSEDSCASTERQTKSRCVRFGDFEQPKEGMDTRLGKRSLPCGSMSTGHTTFLEVLYEV